MHAAPTLVLLPCLTAHLLPGGQVGITRKFVEGVDKFQAYWRGTVRVLMEASPEAGNNLDNLELPASALPFFLKITSFNRLANEPAMRGASVALGSADWRQTGVPEVCQKLGIACALTSEYSLRTRRQMVDALRLNPVRRLKRHLWESWQEERQIRALRLCQGVQCNGTPTFESYQHLTPNPLLFFDSRVTQSMLAQRHELDTRWSRCVRGERLRLLFSGRLIPMKGAEHLVEVAEHLTRLGVEFDLTICGDGESRPRIESEVRHRGLSPRVRLTGTLDFQRELIPRVKRETDLFVCCHPQGDPSCTYLETMSCGVPIVGYDNEAFNGVARASGSGWLTPMNQPAALAQKIAELDMDRLQIVQHSIKALSFAQEHTFERTFRRRVEHLRALAS